MNLAQKARLVQQRSGGEAEEGRRQRCRDFIYNAKRFWKRKIVYFSISRDIKEDFGNNLLYILYMGWGGAASWTVTWPHDVLFLSDV